MKPLTIIGGGLAGLTLGIALRRQGVPVTIVEAGSYPRHKVCGEFISGHGQEVLARLGLLESLRRAGARPAESAAFHFGSFSRKRRLPRPAICLSRYRLDELLAQTFSAAGGELICGRRWREPVGEGCVRATGREAQATDKGRRWFGLKVHAENVRLNADLEMHALTNGYVGICRLDDRRVNVCGLFHRREDASESRTLPQELLRGTPSSSLRERLADAAFDESSFCAVAALSLRPRRATRYTECRVGDALTMTPPVTGNGMSMAFEAASLAADPLAAYSRGELSWDQARSATARACDQAFRRRLFWAARLQSLMLAHAASPALPWWAARLALRSSAVWEGFFKATR